MTKVASRRCATIDQELSQGRSHDHNGDRLLPRFDLKSLILAPVRFYRRFLSPLKARPTCRYLPTCSEYAIAAVERRGVLIGSLKALWRLLRCNPLFRGGYDPVE